MRAWLVVFLLLSACVQSNAVDCGFGLCPSDRVCDPMHDLCVRPDQLTTCAGQADRGPCMVGDRVGSCTDGVCLENQCGDGIVTGTEQCDGNVFANNAHDCTNVGFYDPGTITCRADCTIDVDACSRTCGDQTKDAEEVCEYSAPNADTTCDALGFYETAAVPCTPFCSYDTTACKTRCGDGVLQSNELCEPGFPLPSYLSCLDYGFDSGVTTCGGSCNSDLARCHHFNVVTAGALSMGPQDVWQAGPSTAFVAGHDFDSAGPRGLLLRWDGTTLLPVAPANGASLNAVSGTSATNVFAVGNAGRVAHFDGTTLVDMTAPVSASLYAVFALDATHVYAAGAGPLMERYDGSSWSSMPAPPGGFVVDGIWASSPSNLWAICTSGAVFHFDGTTWSSSVTGTNSAMIAVWGSGQKVFAATVDKIVEYNGTSWATMPLPGTFTFVDLWGASEDDIIAISQTAMLHYDGTRWVKLGATLAAPARISGFDHSHAVVVTQDGRLLRWDGEGDTTPAALASNGSDLWGTASTDLFAATDNGTFHYNGMTWAVSDAVPSNAVWGTASNDVFVASSGIRHFNGSAWTAMTLPLNMNNNSSVFDISGTASDDVYAVTDYGEVLHYDGQWTVVYADPLEIPFTSVWAASNVDIWAVGGGVILHGNGTTWTLIESNVPHGYYAVWGSSDSDVYAVGAAGYAEHFDGTTWSPLVLPRQTRDLNTIHGTGPNDVFIGGAGTLQHFDGTTWAPVSTSLDSGGNDTVRSVWAEPQDITVLGQNGQPHFIVRACPTCL